jgi:hypothetical protein
MAGFFIPDQRFEMPELLEPGRKPVGPVVIDRNHYLSRGIVGCYIFNDGAHTTDLAGNNHGVDVGDVIRGVKKNGKYVYTLNQNGDDRIDLGSITSDNPLSGQATQEMSVYALFEWSTEVAFPRIIDKSTSGNAAGGWAFYPDTGNQRMRFHVSGASVSYGNLGSMSVGQTYGLGVSAKSNDSDFYKDGASIVAGGNNSFTIPTTTARCAISQWNHATTNRHYSAPIYCVFGWDRKLSAAEHKSLHQDPYQMLIPA